MDIQLVKRYLDTVLLKCSLDVLRHIIFHCQEVLILHPYQNINGHRAVIVGTHAHDRCRVAEYLLLLVDNSHNSGLSLSKVRAVAYIEAEVNSSQRSFRIVHYLGIGDLAVWYEHCLSVKGGYLCVKDADILYSSHRVVYLDDIPCGKAQ